MTIVTDGGPAPPRGAPVPVLRGPALSLASSTPDALVRVRELADLLAGPAQAMTQEERTATLTELERLKNVCAAAKSVITVDLDEQAALERRATEGQLGHRRREREGVTLEVALARRCRHRGRGRSSSWPGPCTLGCRTRWRPSARGGSRSGRRRSWPGRPRT